MDGLEPLLNRGSKGAIFEEEGIMLPDLMDSILCSCFNSFSRYLLDTISFGSYVVVLLTYCPCTCNASSFTTPIHTSITILHCHSTFVHLFHHHYEIPFSTTTSATQNLHSWNLQCNPFCCHNWQWLATMRFLPFPCFHV